METSLRTWAQFLDDIYISPSTVSRGRRPARRISIFWPAATRCRWPAAPASPAPTALYSPRPRGQIEILPNARPLRPQDQKPDHGRDPREKHRARTHGPEISASDGIAVPRTRKTIHQSFHNVIAASINWVPLPTDPQVSTLSNNNRDCSFAQNRYRVWVHASFLSVNDLSIAKIDFPPWDVSLMISQHPTNSSGSGAPGGAEGQLADGTACNGAPTGSVAGSSRLAPRDGARCLGARLRLSPFPGNN